MAGNPPNQRSFSWVDHDAIASIRQQKYSTCWAFATISMIEAVSKIHTRKMPLLSEQYLIDCDNKFNKNGLNGGTVRKAFNFIMDRQGVLYDRDVYPWHGESSYCLLDDGSLPAAITIDGFQRVEPRRNEEALLQAVRNQPVTAAVNGERISEYKNGIILYDAREVKPVTHNVVIVGYGTNDEGIDYWLCRNSWGPSWGENGYFRLQRNVPNPEGTCGIAGCCYYPIINRVNN